MPSGALDGQEIAQGASSALGTLAGLQQVQLRLLTCASEIWAQQMNPRALGARSSSSDCTNSDGNSKQGQTLWGLSSFYSKAKRSGGVRFELQLTPD